MSLLLVVRRGWHPASEASDVKRRRVGSWQHKQPYIAAHEGAAADSPPRCSPQACWVAHPAILCRRAHLCFPAPCTSLRACDHSRLLVLSLNRQTASALLSLGRLLLSTCISLASPREAWEGCAAASNPALFVLVFGAIDRSQSKPALLLRLKQIEWTAAVGIGIPWYLQFLKCSGMNRCD